MRQRIEGGQEKDAMTICWSRTHARQGYSSRRRERANRTPGFTLIEVVVAIAILLIVSIGVLRFSIISYGLGTNIVIQSQGQNLAELTAEQLAASSVGQIQGMIKGTPSPNFPANGTGLSSGVPTDGSYHVIAPGEFLVTGITSFFPAGATQIDLPTGPDGAISALGEDSRVDKTSAPVVNDLGIFGEGLPTSTAAYLTYLYSLAPNVAIEPMGHLDPGGALAWDYSGLVLFRSEFPGFLREIKISPLFSGTTDPTQMRYAYSVIVTWTLAARKGTVSVAGERSYVY